MKYIIEFEDIGNGLWRAKGFNTLVFDRNGLNRLEKVKDEIQVGDEVRCFDTRFVVTWIDGDWVYGFTSLGEPLKRRKSGVKKTGRHLDLSEMIDGEDDDE